MKAFPKRKIPGMIAALLIGWLACEAVAFSAGLAQADITATRRSLETELAPLIGPKDAVMVEAEDGIVLARINADRPLVPASVLKILTALAALEKSGEGYRFHTDFMIDEKNNLKIKGYGDPMLVSERLTVIAKKLATKKRQIQDIILDDTFFQQPLTIPGRHATYQPYSAPNGALCVNFNTVAFSRQRGLWVSGEPQTPLLPLAIPKIEASGATSGRITLAADNGEALRYTGQMFRYFFNQAGIQTQGTISRGAVSHASDRLLWRYSSSDNLGEIAEALLAYSNNFIANQLLLVMGAHSLGPPATLAKGLEVLRTYYEKDLGISTGMLVEASGISRSNRLTADAVMKILERFDPYHALLRYDGRQYYKTGHLSGIRTRAGYIVDHSGRRVRFAILLNTRGKTTDIPLKIIEEHLVPRSS